MPGENPPEVEDLIAADARGEDLSPLFAYYSQTFDVILQMFQPESGDTDEE